MEVLQREFDLYFLGVTKDKLPNKNIEALENREWLWQRDFTMIELQHLKDYSSNEDFLYEVGKTSGFEGITIADTGKKSLLDPDNYKITIKAKDSI
jgi:hypothetical protein